MGRADFQVFIVNLFRMVTLALSGSLDKERLFSATSELVNLCAFSCKACDSFCIFNVHLFSFPTFASCTQRGTKAPPSLTQGVFLRTCTFCILVGNIFQVHFFFHVRLYTVCIIVEHISKAQFRFQFGKELNLFFSQNLMESSFVFCSSTTHKEHPLGRKPIIALLFTVIVFQTLQDSIQHIAMCSNVHCYVSDTLQNCMQHVAMCCYVHLTMIVFQTLQDSMGVFANAAGGVNEA